MLGPNDKRRKKTEKAVVDMLAAMNEETEQSVEKLLRKKAKKAQKNAELNKLEYERLMQRAQIEEFRQSQLVQEVVANNDVLPKELSKKIQSANKTAEKFRQTKRKTAAAGFKEYFDVDWRASYQGFLDSLPFHGRNGEVTDPRIIEQSVESGEILQPTIKQAFRSGLEEAVTSSFQSYVKGKIEDSIEKQKEQLEAIISDPLTAIGAGIDSSASKADAAESSAIDTMYKLSNFLANGKYEISMTQRLKMIGDQLSSYFTSSESMKEDPRSWEELIHGIQRSVHDDEPEKIMTQLENFFRHEGDKLSKAIDAVDGALEEAMKHDKPVERIIENAEKEINKRAPYDLVSTLYGMIQSSAPLVDTAAKDKRSMLVTYKSEVKASEVKQSVKQAHTKEKRSKQGIQIKRRKRFGE